MRRTWIGLLWILALTGLAIAPGDTSYVVGIQNGLLLLMNGVAAALIVALCTVGGRAESLLLSSVPKFLGRISYSLYLTHLVVIVSLLHLLGQSLPLPLATTAAVLLSIGVADVCQRYIEAPSQRLGKRLARRFDAGPSASLGRVVARPRTRFLTGDKGARGSSKISGNQSPMTQIRTGARN